MNTGKNGGGEKGAGGRARSAVSVVWAGGPRGSAVSHRGPVGQHVTRRSGSQAPPAVHWLSVDTGFSVSDRKDYTRNRFLFRPRSFIGKGKVVNHEAAVVQTSSEASPRSTGGGTACASHHAVHSSRTW